MIYIYAILAIVSVAFDSLRDKYSNTAVGCSWITWHVYKEISFLTPYGMIGYLLVKYNHLNWREVAVCMVVMACSLVWRVIYNSAVNLFNHERRKSWKS